MKKLTCLLALLVIIIPTKANLIGRKINEIRSIIIGNTILVERTEKKIDVFLKNEAGNYIIYADKCEMSKKTLVKLDDFLDRQGAFLNVERKHVLKCSEVGENAGEELYIYFGATEEGADEHPLIISESSLRDNEIYEVNKIQIVD